MSGLFGGGSNSGVAGGLPTGVKLAAAALLAHQLMKHARAVPRPPCAAGGPHQVSADERRRNERRLFQ